MVSYNKKCPKCCRVLSGCMFTKDSSKTSGCGTYCKDCYVKIRAISRYKLGDEYLKKLLNSQYGILSIEATCEMIEIKRMVLESLRVSKNIRKELNGSV